MSVTYEDYWPGVRKATETREVWIIGPRNARDHVEVGPFDSEHEARQYLWDWGVAANVIPRTMSFTYWERQDTDGVWRKVD